MNVEIVGNKRSARDQRMKVKVASTTIIINVESVWASVMKDVAMTLVMVALFVVLLKVGAPMNFVAGVVSILLVMLILKIVFDMAGKPIQRSVTPDDAVEFIEQEIEEAVEAAKQKGDRL